MSELKNNYVTVNYDQDNNMSAGLGNVYELTPVIAQGPAMNQRIGNVIRYKNMQIRLYINSIKVWQVISCPLRVVIFKPRVDMDVTTISNISSLLFMEPVATNNQYLNTIDYNNAWVLFDKVLPFSSTGGYDQTGGKNQYYFKKNFKINNKVQFKLNPLVAPAAIQDRYFMYVIPPFSTALTASWSIEFISRVTYRDA